MKNNQPYFEIEKPDFESLEKETSLEDRWELTRWACTTVRGILMRLLIDYVSQGITNSNLVPIQGKVKLEAQRPSVANLPADWGGLGGRLGPRCRGTTSTCSKLEWVQSNFEAATLT
ncbi:hypothetical protein AOLI_G00229450 [Acnodon oligacanthus]